ncbi:MAG: HAD family hydrolase, partial [Candidatus Glassbacteria bacterium]
FKLAGRYNNDWELSDGAVAFELMKLLEAGGGNGITTGRLRRQGPPLEEFTGAVKARGGGLDNTLQVVRERLEPDLHARFSELYRPEQIKRIFMEHYAGQTHCRQLYGFDPEYYQGPGLVEKEVFLLDLHLAERLRATGVEFGILSGRTPEEADFLILKTGLDSFLDPRFVITDNGSFPGKPDPTGLRLLAERMKFRGAVYVGDVPDDWTTVANYEAGRGTLPPVAGCLVSTGATSPELMQGFYSRSAVHYLAADVNHLLSAWLAARTGGKLVTENLQ